MNQSKKKKLPKLSGKAQIKKNLDLNAFMSD